MDRRETPLSVLDFAVHIEHGYADRNPYNERGLHNLR